MMVIVAIIVLMRVIVATVMAILVVAIALVPMVFAVTVVVLSKVSVVNVVVGSNSVMASVSVSAVSVTAIPSAIGPTSIAMVIMLLVPMPLVFTVLGMVVPKPQQGIELFVELVVVFVVGVDLVQMLAKFLTESDDGWAVRAIGKLASGWSCGVFDL